jgi:sulfide dehydrogenase [flavocytochrome c] flavoprotein chain
MTTTRITRRTFNAMASASIGTLAGLRAYGKPRPNVVVIGGGPGGATAARYIAIDAGGAIDVTLIEPQRRFTTCFFSNHYVGGLRSLAAITHGYSGLRRAGVRVIHERAAAVDRARRRVALGSGQRIAYDRLIVAPGIDMRWDSVPGYSEAAAATMPHAWKAGAQTELLVRKLNALDDGSIIVMVAPPNPYRCPPGPYERASMFAHVLKSKGHTRSRIVIVDSKPSFSKQALFVEGWARHYPGMIDWLDPQAHGGVIEVVPSANEVRTARATHRAALVNVIPAQTAGSIAHAAALVDQSGFCPIRADSMRSKIDDNVFVIGDACVAGEMPKSAFSANSQAKVAALAVRADLVAAQMLPASYLNTCWSLIAAGDCVKVGATYAPAEDKIKAINTFVSQTGETNELRARNLQEANDWYAGIVRDTFG